MVQVIMSAFRKIKNPTQTSFVNNAVLIRQNVIPEVRKPEICCGCGKQQT